MLEKMNECYEETEADLILRQLNENPEKLREDCNDPYVESLAEAMLMKMLEDEAILKLFIEFSKKYKVSNRKIKGMNLESLYENFCSFIEKHEELQKGVSKKVREVVGLACESVQTFFKKKVMNV